MNAVANNSTATSLKPRRVQLSIGALIAVAILLFWFFVAVFGPLLAPYNEADIVSDHNLARPAAAFFLGTDYIGRDILSRLMAGARTTLGMGLTATLIAEFVGVYLGLFAAIRGGLVDTLMSRLNDALLSFPHIMMGLVVIAALGSSIPVLIVTSGFIYASAVFRIARALAMELREMEFIEAARARGEGVWWVLFREMLPNAALPLLTDFALRLSFIILFMSSLSFLGLGVQPPVADWGSMVRENIEGLGSGSLAPIIPAAAIASITVALNLLVDELSLRSGRDYRGGRE
ncbi:ABC transporter permease [Bradyrhizobium sp. RDI18]|uniref:ABC transporter permease n=1 Tax=Bradyrhizobium sp. RDI18 TaxID=3367400 RepID=UPI003712963A